MSSSESLADPYSSDDGYLKQDPRIKDRKNIYNRNGQKKGYLESMNIISFSQHYLGGFYYENRL